MIKFEFFTYSDEQWNKIKEQVLDELGVDVDQIKRQITSVIRNGDFEESLTGMQSLRSRIEITANQYRVYSAVNRLSPRRDELDALRKDAKNVHASIISALSVRFDAGYGVVVPMLFNGVDADMLNATSDYFRKLAANLDRQIEQAGSSRDNARKTARDQCWNELLAIWCELGGKPSGAAAASFLIAASKPVMGSAVPTLKSVVQWLERRRNKTAKTVRRRTIR